ncbi:MAG: C39 family peptidase [Rubripirellula sp.]
MTASEFNELRFGTRSPLRDELVKSQAYVKNARQLRNENVVMQQRDFSCGAAALATVLNYYWGENVSETALLLIIANLLSREELEDRVLNGLTLTDLKNVAQIGGFTAVLGKLTIEKLADTKLPLVVAITVNNYDHFVVFRGMDDEYVYIADPIFGKKKELIATFAEQWQQNAILAVIKPGEPPKLDSPLLVKEIEKKSYLQSKQFIQFQLTGRVNP